MRPTLAVGSGTGMPLLPTIVLALNLVIVIITATFFGLVFSQASEISRQFIVYTGMRTRSADHSNIYPVASPENDAFARVYGCMMDAEIGRGVGECDTQKSIDDYQTCIKARPSKMSMSCENFIHFPVEGATMTYLQCIQGNFNITTRKTNVFLECLELSQPTTYESFQNINSGVFLGSYNYAVLLVSGLAVMASFLVLTSAGWFFQDHFELNSSKHITGIYSPFSIYRIFVAWIWDFAFLIAIIFISYLNSGPASLEDGTKRFPLTVWTCVLSISVFALSTAFLTTYVFEWARPGQNSASEGSRQDAEQQGAGTGSTDLPPSGESASSFFRSTGKRRYDSRSYSPSTLTHRFPQMVQWNRGHYIGVQLYKTGAMDSEVTEEHVMSQLIQHFSWTWVFVDGLIFVGLLSPQTSITNESVVRVFVGIVAARLFQLASSYLTHKAFLGEINQEVDEARSGAVLSSVTDHLASLICMVIVALDFLSTTDFSYHSSLATSSSASAYGIQWATLIVLIILPELWRTINILSMTFKVYQYSKQYQRAGQNNSGSISVKAGNQEFLMSFQLLYTWEYMARIIICAVAIFSLPGPVKDQHVFLSKYLALSA